MTLVYNTAEREREIERVRQTDRQTDTHTEPIFTYILRKKAAAKVNRLWNEIITVSLISRTILTILVRNK